MVADLLFGRWWGHIVTISFGKIVVIILETFILTVFKCDVNEFFKSASEEWTSIKTH